MGVEYVLPFPHAIFISLATLPHPPALPLLLLHLCESCPCAPLHPPPPAPQLRESLASVRLQDKSSSQLSVARTKLSTAATKIGSLLSACQVLPGASGASTDAAPALQGLAEQVCVGG